MKRSALHVPVALVALALAAMPARAASDAGINIAASTSSETYTFAAGEATVDWTRILLMPWFSTGPWKFTADIPYLMRDAQTTGATTGLWHTGGNWSLAPVPSGFEESDSGLGDIALAATYSWQPERWLRPYLVAELKLPTGDEDAVEVHFNTAFADSSRNNSATSFGNGSTDLRVGPGIELRNDLGWARTEASYILSQDNGDIPVEDRVAAFAGLGWTPLKWLEFTAGFHYEDEVVDGSGELQQTSLAINVRPEGSRMVISLSTYENDDAPDLEDNWSLGVAAGF